MVYDIVKIHKKLGYTFSLINAILEKLQGKRAGVKIDSSGFSGFYSCLLIDTLKFVYSLKFPFCFLRWFYHRIG